jgi:LmbE family N-acetylglucosaminyl deacetylase
MIGIRVSDPAELGWAGTLLGVWAHPDDEAYLSSGLMACARAAGHRVVVVTATYGELGGDPDRWPPERLRSERATELAASLAAVGVEEHHVLGYPDGGCADVPADDAVARLRAVLREVAPHTIVTFGPDGMTGHADHRTVSAWTTRAWREAGGPARLWYATKTPGFHREWGGFNDQIGLFDRDGPPPQAGPDELALALRCDGPLLDTKIAALAAHHSQTAALVTLMGPARYREWVAEEAFAAAAEKS